jgi:hypothetical protein
MRTVMTAVALVLAGGIVSSALAFKEPDDFRGVPWGATEKALRDKLGEASAHGFEGCQTYSPEDRWLGNRYCLGAFPLAGIPVDAVYSFRANRFVRVNLTFPAQDFDRLAAIFVERYGPPTSSTRERYKTKGGAEAVNEILKWSGPRIAISLERYGSRITNGSARIVTRSELEESARLHAEQTKGAAKGL